METWRGGSVVSLDATARHQANIASKMRYQDVSKNNHLRFAILTSMLSCARLNSAIGLEKSVAD